MRSASTKRRLAAILAADVVGYSRLMNQDEERTLRVLNQRLRIFQYAIPQHDGCIFGGAGDSVIAEFPSAVEAVRRAVEVQQALAKHNAEAPEEDRMQFRPRPIDQRYTCRIKLIKREHIQASERPHGCTAGSVLLLINCILGRSLCAIFATKRSYLT